jgi:hypothetical protein
MYVNFIAGFFYCSGEYLQVQLVIISIDPPLNPLPRITTWHWTKFPPTRPPRLRTLDRQQEARMVWHAACRLDSWVIPNYNILLADIFTPEATKSGFFFSATGLANMRQEINRSFGCSCGLCSSFIASFTFIRLHPHPSLCSHVLGIRQISMSHTRMTPTSARCKILVLSGFAHYSSSPATHVRPG